jgi:hypothetical protein
MLKEVRNDNVAKNHEIKDHIRRLIAVALELHNSRGHVDFAIP